MKTLEPPVAELCSAKYAATQLQIPDGARQVWILAIGEHPTSGYEVHFTQSPLDVFPPQFAFWHTKPTGIVLDVITEFSKFTGFDADQTVDKVVVADSAGDHEVPVQQIGSLEKTSFLANVFGMLKDGPFPKAGF